MRVLHYLFVTLVVLMTVACSEDDPVGQVPTEPSDPSVPEGIILNKDNEFIVFDCVAGEKEISFKTSQSWKVEVPSTSRDWLTVTPISGEKGSSVVTFSVKANETYENRAAEVFLTSGADKKTITVTQVQKDALVIAKSSYTVAQGGDNISVEVGHNVDFDVNIDSDWIKQSKSRAYVTETLKFTVAKNSTFSKREGVITFVSKDGSIKQEVKVYQAPNDGLIVSKNEYVFNAKQHTFDIEIKANVDYRIEDPKVSWLHRIESRALTSRTVRYQVDANEDVEGRVAEIRIVSADGKLSEIVTVTQVQKDALVVAKNSYTVSQEGEDIFIEVGHNVDFDIKIDADWIKQSQSRAYVTEKLKFTVAKNPDTSNREGSIIFTSKDGQLKQVVKVYQSSRDGLIVSKNEYVFSAEQHTFDIEIKANVDYQIEDPNVGWLHRIESRSLTSRTVRYQVDANEDVEGRVAEIRIVSADGKLSEIVTVTQVQKDALVVAKNSYTVAQEGGEINIEVGHNVDFNVSIDADWIKQSHSRAYVTENLKFVVAKNPDASNREGQITFTSKDGNLKQVVKVYQSPSDKLIVSKNEYVFNSGLHTFDIEIRSNVEYKVEEPNVGWLHRIESRSLTSRTLRYQVDANEDVEARAAEIRIVSADGKMTETVTVSQVQKDALVVAKNSYTVGQEGEGISIEVGHNVDFTVKIDVDWITQVTSRAYVKENIQFAVAKNPDTSNREGHITFTSKNGKIQQVVKVYQSSRSGLIVSKHDHIFDSNQHEFDIEIKSNVEYKIEDPKIAWLHRLESRALTSRTVRYRVDANEDVEGRVAEIRIVSADGTMTETVTVSQMQKDALVVAKPSYTVVHGGGEITIEVGHNVDFTISIDSDWITQLTSRAYIKENIKFAVAKNMQVAERKGKITFTSKDKKIRQEVLVVQESKSDERKILVDLYNATNGPQWKDHTNWCSDKPLSEWYGIQLDSEGYVSSINLPGNNLSGTIPESIGALSRMYWIQLAGNQLTGEIPATFCNLTQLMYVFLGGNQLSGTIPEHIGNLTQLARIDLSYNKLTGGIPESITQLTRLEGLTLAANQLTGRIPVGVLQSTVWATQWPGIVEYNNFDLVGVSLPAPKFTVNTVNGNRVSDSLYGMNKMTILLQFRKNCPYSREYMHTILRVYEICHKQGLEVLGISLDDPTITKQYMTEKGITWDAFCYRDNSNDYHFSMNGATPEIFVVDSKGNVVFSSILENRNDLEIFLSKYFNMDLYKPYESVDYSQDGQTVALQTATEGNGVDLVIMGDGYSDRQIASGEYAKDMKFVGEKFFTVEPYKSFKHLFNVHYVTTVSKNEGYSQNGNTALSGWFGNGTQVGGNDNKCMEYAKKAISPERMDNAVIIVVMNSNKYAGTCWMYSSRQVNDYGSGISVAYFSKGEDPAQFEQLLHHEAGGHGFAKLADEYSYPGVIPAKEIDTYHQLEPKGWWKNIDFTNNPTQIKWAHFLSDIRYKNDVGIYEGGCTYAQGVWHSSEENIMIHNVGGFNAPSREAIYYRLHKLAKGDSWTYNYEDFVKYDAVNRNQLKSRVSVPRNFKPLHRPMVLNKTWQEASSDNRR